MPDELFRKLFRRFILAMQDLGMFGEFGLLGEQVKKMAVWSPYGTVKRVIAAGMQPEKWTAQISIALLITLGYAVVFAVIGIRKFKWNSK